MIENRIGVAFSGGGYRASAFHVGTLRALNKMGILERVDVLSTISGGSITGAAYSLHQGDLASFDTAMLTAVSTKSVIRYILTSWLFLRFAIIPLVFLGAAGWFLFRGHPWLFIAIIIAFLVILIRYQFRLFPVGNVIERAYNKFFFHDATLSSLSPKPELAIGATNLQTCRPFTFSPRKMEDSVYAYYSPPVRFKHTSFPVAKAVMASTCVPFAFTPVRIDLKFFVDPEDSTRCNPVLIDGGVYDNQGVHKITQSGSSYECQYIITSDAGNRLPFEKSYNNSYTLLLRTVNVFMVRIKNFQMALHLYREGRESKKEVAYLSLDWDVANCIPGFLNNLENGKVPQSVIDSHNIPNAWLESVSENRAQITSLLKANVRYNEILASDLSAEDLTRIRSVRTNLTRIPLETAQLLARHAANMTELQIRLYCPSLCK